MSLKAYKRFSLISRRGGLISFAAILMGGLGVAFSAPEVPAARPNAAAGIAVATATIHQVEWIARHTRTLDALGKATMAESATMLDLGEAALPLLTTYFKSGRNPWKVRYWAADLLGYIGTPATCDVLVRAAENPHEQKAIRLRAVDSIVGIAERFPSEKIRLGKTLGKIMRGTNDLELRKKLKGGLRGLEGGRKQ